MNAEQTDNEINEVLARANRWVWTHDPEIDTWWWIRKGGLSTTVPDYINDPALIAELLDSLDYYSITGAIEDVIVSCDARRGDNGTCAYGDTIMQAVALAVYQLIAEGSE